MIKGSLVIFDGVLTSSESPILWFPKAKTDILTIRTINCHDGFFFAYFEEGVIGYHNSEEIGIPLRYLKEIQSAGEGYEILSSVNS